MTVFVRTLILLMVWVMFGIPTSANHTGMEDSSTNASQVARYLPKPGFSRADWGFSFDGVDFYFGRVKVIDTNNVVVQKLFAEIGQDNSPAPEGLRIFIDQFQYSTDKANRQAISAQNIYLGCRDSSTCNKTFQTNEQEILVGFTSLRILVEQDRTAEKVKESSLPLIWWHPGSKIVGTINRVKFDGLLKHLIRMKYFEAEHLPFMDDYLITLDFQATVVNSARAITGVVKADGKALVKYLITPNPGPDGNSIGGWSVKLTEITSREIPKIGTHRERKAARLGVIAFIQFLSQLFPKVGVLPDNSQINHFVGTGVPLEIPLKNMVPHENDPSNRVLDVLSHIENERAKFKEAKVLKVQAF